MSDVRSHQDADGLLGDLAQRLPNVAPAGSVTLYKAFAACHMGGALLGFLGTLTAPASVISAWRSPLLALMVAQLALAWWLWRRPMLIPRLMLGWPRTTWLLGVALTLAVMAPAISYAAFPSARAAACWAATAAAVGPRHGWPLLGAALALAVAAIWMLHGRWQTAISGETIWVALAQLGPVLVNGAWMGAAGSASAWRLRRWGVIVAADDGALRRLRDAGARVRDAADALLVRVASGTTADHAIAAKQLGETGVRDASRTEAVVLLNAVVEELRAPFTVTVSGDRAVGLTREHWAVVRAAVLRHLSNVVRHAPTATAVTVTVATTSAGIEITCADDGGGRAPSAEDEHEGSALSRGALAELGGELRYVQGEAGVQLKLRLPVEGPSPSDPQLGLGGEVRAFVDVALRNNRIVSWLVPVPAMQWAFGVDWRISVVFLVGGLACEVIIARMGPSGHEPGPILPLAACGAITVGLAAMLSVGVTSTSIYPAAGATSYPIVEAAWRGRWWLWGVLEFARFVAVIPWVWASGPAALISAYLFPLAATVIVLGGQRLVRRAEELDRSVGNALAWREAQARSARDASLRHDVVSRLLSAELDPVTADAVDELDRATVELVSLQAAYADPVADSIATACHMLDPVPVRVPARLEQRTASADEFHVARRLARLEAVATAGLRLLDEAPPRWDGRRGLRSVQLEVRRTGRGVALVLQPRPHGEPVEVTL